MADQKFEGLARSNLNPEQLHEVESLWHRYALAALQGITRTIDHGETDPGEVAELAGDYADEMLAQWDDRFNPETWLNELPEESQDPGEQDLDEMLPRAAGARRGHDGREGRRGGRGGRRS